MNERQALMILAALPDLGPITVRRLQEHTGGSTSAIFDIGQEELRGLVGVKRTQAIREWPKHFDLEREERKLGEIGARFVVDGEEGYPPLLSKLVDAPLGLYQRGPARLKGPAIAVVGTRGPSQYGLKVTRQFVRGLVEAGFTIVSGLALGVDTEAHRAALEAGGETVAVLGNGVDRLYPPQNRGLAAAILEQGGGIWSEFYLGRPADRQTFPQRNRIVSGMSHGTLVVESPARGGSLITARFAMEQNRTVFAIPGRLDQPSSRGCLELIRDGATLVTGVEDILEELRFMQLDLPLQVEGQAAAVPSAEELNARLGPEELKVITAMELGQAFHPDQICDRAEMPSFQVHAALMMLELQRRVARNADGTYERVD